MGSSDRRELASLVQETSAVNHCFSGLVAMEGNTHCRMRVCLDKTAITLLALGGCLAVGFCLAVRLLTAYYFWLPDMGLIGVSLSKPHIAVVPFALYCLYACCLLPVLADCAKMDRMWALTISTYIVPYQCTCARSRDCSILRVSALPRSRDC